MSDIVKVKNVKLARYEELILQKGNLQRKGEEVYTEYIREFGNLEIERYQATLECMKVKEMINYCQRKVNRNEMISKLLMELSVDDLLQESYQKLEDLVKDKEDAEKSTMVSYVDILQMKKAYRHIMKLIHPDLNPELFQKPGVKDLYEKTNIDYRLNHVHEVLEDEVIANKMAKDYKLGNEEVEIKRIDEKINKLLKEIEEMEKNPPLSFQSMMESLSLKEEHKKELEEEIHYQKTYLGVLQDRLKQFNIIEV